VRRGDFVVNYEHQAAGVYFIALNKYQTKVRTSAYPPPDAVRDMLDAIDIALALGVIEPRRERLEKLSQEIKNKRVTKKDIDSVESDSSPKNYVKALSNTSGDKSPKEIAKELSDIARKGMIFATFIQVLVEIAKGLAESASSVGFV
jgi:hypothetical protein